MALSVSVIRTLSLFPNGVFLQWELTGAVESGPYLATVFRSGSPGGPWDLLVDSSPDLASFTDHFPLPASPTNTDPNQLSLSRGLFYRVRVVPPSGPSAAAEVVSAVEPLLTGRQRLVRRKIVRDEYVMLSRLNGVEVAVLKRKHWGQRCPKCFDPYTGESMRGSCGTCFGTTFVGGFFDPIVVWAKRSPVPVQVALSPEGKAETAFTGIIMLDAPAVRDDDVLVFLRDNRRFLVRRVLPTELRTVTVHQRLEVSELARSDVLYRFPVDFQAAPRLFSP
jgi:hypothetical protein